MVTIISKQEGISRREEKLKHVLRQNRGTIEGMTNFLKHGPMAHLAKETSAPVTGPEASGKTTIFRTTSSEGDAKPYVRVRMNGGVVVIDYETGQQLHHLGDVRGKGASARFAVATKANGFFAPVDDEIAEWLKDIDGRPIPDRDAEETLKDDVAKALGLTD